MNKIHFDIRLRPEIEAGKYKVFFAEKPARIICWDKKSSRDGTIVVALVDDGKSEHTEYFYADGNAICENSPSLWVAPVEQELTAFEKRLAGIIEVWMDEDLNPVCKVNNGKLRADARDLITIAQRQLCSICKSRSDGYQTGLEEARKDLPRWRKSALDFEHGAIGETIDGRDVLSYKGYEIIIEDILDKLPKEEEI